MRLVSVLRSSPAGIGCLADGIIAEANSQLCELTGHKQADLVGLPVERLFARVGEGQSVLSQLRDQLGSNPIARLETTWLRRDGRAISVALTVSSMPTPDARELWAFTVLDETSHQEALDEITLCHQQLAGFHSISEIMQGDEPDSTAFNAIARKVSEIAGFPVVAIELCDFNRAVMIYCGSHGVDLEGLPEPLEIPMDVTPSGQVQEPGSRWLRWRLPSARSVRRHSSANLPRKPLSACRSRPTNK